MKLQSHSSERSKLPKDEISPQYVNKGVSKYVQQGQRQLIIDEPVPKTDDDIYVEKNNPGWKDSPQWKAKNEKSTHYKTTVNPSWIKSDKKSAIKNPAWNQESSGKYQQIAAKNPALNPVTSGKYQQNPGKNPGWNWVESRSRSKPDWNKQMGQNFDANSIRRALNLTDTLGSKYLSRNGSKIINWMIKNMPDGKQTIIVL